LEARVSLALCSVDQAASFWPAKHISWLPGPRISPFEIIKFIAYDLRRNIFIWCTGDGCAEVDHGQRFRALNRCRPLTWAKRSQGFSITIFEEILVRLAFSFLFPKPMVHDPSNIALWHYTSVNPHDWLAEVLRPVLNCNIFRGHPEKEALGFQNPSCLSL
jgi:hypothetical protein